MKRTEALDFPKSILIETTNKCNGFCVFCPYREIRAKQKTEYLSLDVIKKILIEISLYYVERISLFNNNEPLLDDRIFDIISYAKKTNSNCELALSTNGYLLTNQIAKKLYDCGLTTLYISIPSLDRERYYELMNFNLQTVLSQINSIDTDILKKMIRIAVPKTYAYVEDDFKAYFKQLGIKVCTWTLEYKKKWKHIDFNKIKYCNDDINRKQCDRCLDQVVILSNGNLVLCCRDWLEETVIGNVKNSSILELWTSEKMKEYQNYTILNNYDNIPLCKDCSENKKNNNQI